MEQYNRRKLFDDEDEEENQERKKTYIAHIYQWTYTFFV